jgi:hypothetical protein
LECLPFCRLYSAIAAVDEECQLAHRHRHRRHEFTSVLGGIPDRWWRSVPTLPTRLTGHKAQLFVAMHASEPLWTCYIWPAIVGSWGKRVRRREIIALISSAAAALPLLDTQLNF